MKELAEATWTDNAGEEPREIREKVWVLHFGVKSTIVDAGDGRLFGVSNTIAVCQNIKTGQLEGWDIEQLRIIGTELK